MITALDLEYHHTEKDDYTWGETYYLPVSIPEERIFGHIYVCVRPVLGCMQNDVRFIGAVSETEFEALYVDTRFHLPAPERLSHRLYWARWHRAAHGHHGDHGPIRHPRSRSESARRQDRGGAPGSDVDGQRLQGPLRHAWAVQGNAEAARRRVQDRHRRQDEP